MTALLLLSPRARRYPSYTIAPSSSDMSYRITAAHGIPWHWVCPTPHEHRDVRVVDGLFECRSCGETFRRLRNLRENEDVLREHIEIVGPDADHKGAFGQPTVEEE